MDHSAACLFRNCFQNPQIHPTISTTFGSQWSSHQPTVLKDASIAAFVRSSHQPTVLKDASIAAFVPFHVVDTMTLPNRLELN
jgi:hypothetical protein